MIDSDLFWILSRHFWLFTILLNVASAAFWRIKARGRIKADPTLREPLNRLYGGYVFWLSLPFLVMGAGIVTGHTHTFFEYLRFDAADPFILSFHALVIAEDALFLVWVFFRNGDETMALHKDTVDARSKFRITLRIVAIAAPVLHVFVVYRATSSSQFGQFLNIIGA